MWFVDVAVLMERSGELTLGRGESLGVEQMSRGLAVGFPTDAVEFCVFLSSDLFLLCPTSLRVLILVLIFSE